MLAALAANSGESYADTLQRGCALLLAYAVYGIACTAITLFVSARARTAASALLILLSLWAVCVVMAPRLAASVAERLYATPASTLFWSTTADTIRERRRAARDSGEYRAMERAVVGAAIGREVSSDELTSVSLNRQGVALEISERIEAETYEDAYRKLYETYAAQARIRRVIAALSPTIALQHLSSTLASTDISSHEHFSLAAERHRRLMIRRINEDMMLQGATKGFDYIAGSDLWTRIPKFTYTPPPAVFAFRSSLWDGLLLLAFAVTAAALARWAADRQSIA
jgi:ABC-2 type transport system permease protein